MYIPFFKYHAQGNDFVLIDDRLLNLCKNIAIDKLCQNMCHRHFGIGANGLILLAHHDNFNFEMLFYNPDGSLSMCGNGARCAVHLAQKLNIISYQAQFIHQNKLYHAHIDTKKNIHLIVQGNPVIVKESQGYIVHNGAKHYITFTENLSNFSLYSGYYDIVKRGILHHNFNAVQYINKNHIKLRTYENGVFAETLSCGTGAIAAALVSAQKYSTKSPTLVSTPGGQLTVTYHKQSTTNAITYDNIVLIGNVSFLFEGKYLYTPSTDV